MIMPVCDSTKRIIINLAVLVAGLLCTSYQPNAQVRIRGLSIPKPGRSDKPNTNQTERTKSNSTNNGIPDGNSGDPPDLVEWYSANSVYPYFNSGVHGNAVRLQTLRDTLSSVLRQEA